MDEKYMSAIMDEMRSIKILLARLCNNYKESASLPNELLTVKQAAEFLGLSVSTLHFYTRPQNPKIPSYPIGRHKRFKQADLAAWCEKNRKGTAQEERQDYVIERKEKRYGKPA